jgi:hypothetical protein
MKSTKQHNFGGFNVGITNGVIYQVHLSDELSFTKIGLGIQVMLRLLPQQSERQQCWFSSGKDL